MAVHCQLEARDDTTVIINTITEEQVQPKPDSIQQPEHTIHTITAWFATWRHRLGPSTGPCALSDDYNMIHYHIVVQVGRETEEEAQPWAAETKLHMPSLSAFSFSLIHQCSNRLQHLVHSYISLLSSNQHHHFRLNYFRIYFINNKFEKSRCSESQAIFASHDSTMT
jgi:hypothetical protein